MSETSEELKIVPRGKNVKGPRKGQNMIAVASGKGGVGKTWFSITLAHALSGFKQKTLLFDGDLGLANIDIQLGLMVQDDLGSVIAERDSQRIIRIQYRASDTDSGITLEALRNTETEHFRPVNIPHLDRCC